MNYSNIERNKLDFILTDLLPVEISELFSLNDFYCYLVEHQKELSSILQELRKTKETNNSILFENGWGTTPLKYNILKGDNTYREMSLIQPMSMINIYLFLELYQKEILILLREKSIFSLRYHQKSSNLYYKKRIRKISEYYQKVSQKVDRGVLQQTGVFYKIAPYNSVSSFTESNLWQQLNFKYRNFAKMDYKSCFDSIYTHSYKWITQKNVVDSKTAKNSSLFFTVDRLMQNVNGLSTNGIVVGPEFSRMIVEVLLQQIDVEVNLKLRSKGYVKDKDYNIYRYVDDIFIFANSSTEIDEIILIISDIAQKYMLHPNDLKMFKTKTPFITSNWLYKARNLAKNISGLFYSEKELKERDEKYIIKDGILPIARIKDEFNSIICNFEEEKRKIVSYSLTTILNKISKKKNNVQLLKSDKRNKAFTLIELALYFFAYYPCFEHAQRIISIIVYFNEELDFLKDKNNHQKLQKCFSKYMFVFLNGNLNDLCNLLLFFREYNIEIPTEIEDQILVKIYDLDNPLLLANYLLYSKYHDGYFHRILIEVEELIKENIDQMSDSDLFLQKEFWYIIIFINCPFLSNNLRGKMKEKLEKIKGKEKYPSGKVADLVCEYLQQSNNNLFFTWGVHRFSISKQIAFRTYQRTLFRNYKKRNLSVVDGSF